MEKCSVHSWIKTFDRRTFNQKKHLLILDLDETLIDQRSIKEIVHEMDTNKFKQYNKHELVFNYDQYERRTHRSSRSHTNANISTMTPRRRLTTISDSMQRRSIHKIDVGLFRPNVMKLIHSLQTQNVKQSNYEYMDYDLMIYSIASYRKVVYQTITMEMYYNYVYAHRYMMSNINNTANARKRIRQEFKFKHVVSKFDDLRLNIDYKSLEILMRLIGSNGELLNKYVQNKTYKKPDCFQLLFVLNLY